MDKNARRFGRWPTITPLGLALACTTNNPVKVTPDAVGLSQYLEAHPSSDLQVTDTEGHRYWLHDPVVRNDSLIGVKSRAEPDVRRGLPLSKIRSLARPEFDTPKTIGLASGIVIGMVTIVAVMESEQGALIAPLVVGGE
jgi:hypothetical protein